MKARTLFAVTVLCGAAAARTLVAQTPINPPPVAPNAFITVGSLDWVWASPCDGGCSQIIFQDGFRYATIAEWASRPLQSAFLDPNGNFTGGGGRMRCGSPWFDLVHDHCDYGNPETSGPLNGQVFDGFETWLVRDGVAVVPEPGSLALVATGLVGIVGIGRRRFTRG